jgi:hypothetical protein
MAITHEDIVATRPAALCSKCYVGKVPSGELKFVIYINSFHRFLPDAAPIEIR